MTGQRFSVVEGQWAIVRMAPAAAVPEWALSTPGFVSVTRTPEELSIVAPEASVPLGCQADRGWALIKLHGPFPFTAIGVLSSVASPLAAAAISVIAISTFDTDYVLVKAAQVQAASGALVAAGHERVP